MRKRNELEENQEIYSATVMLYSLKNILKYIDISVMFKSWHTTLLSHLRPPFFIEFRYRRFVNFVQLYYGPNMFIDCL